MTITPTKTMVALTIDGIPVHAPAGTSVMHAARDAGIAVAKLCATDSLQAFGSCRLCVVDIAGRKGLPASCTTPVEEGMVVRTQTEKVARVRRNVMELYISDHPLDCLTCAANGDCELQDMAGAVGLREVRYGMDGANHLQTDVSQDRHTEGDRNVQAHTQLATNLNFSKCPRAESTQRTHRDELPQAALHHRCEFKPIRNVWRGNVDLPKVPRGTHGRTPQNHDGSGECEKDGGDTKETDVKRTDPKIKKVTPKQGPTAYTVFAFKT